MKKLFKSQRDNKLTGVCGGLAEFFGIDSTIVRVLVVITALFSFGGVLLAYILAAIFIPKSPIEEIPFAGSYRHY
ncbi:PspC domain-containing protein [Paenibacillus sp. GCM10027627]|uniref:PspC domain-containing protein n=1 Tax=unclassified Paenibacillus TaxID=185978 RepID=UPI003637F201